VADALTSKRQEALVNDARNLNRAIGLRTQREVFAIARKTLTDLATTSLEERMVDVFTRRVRELNGKTKAGLAEALKTASEPALVHSAFELPAEQRAAIQRAVNETFSADIRLCFETAPDLISGIDLTANGQKLAWSIAPYLRSLEASVGELLNTQAKSEPTEDRASDAKPSA
jgi:F-type H+-transporting ATPase subunit b